MHQYSSNDKVVVHGRVDEFCRQTNRFFHGLLSDDHLRTVRPLNGLYVERQTPMLRMAIPYGEFLSDQLLGFALLPRKFKTYIDNRNSYESFLTTYRRIGIKPFKEAVYG